MEQQALEATVATLADAGTTERSLSEVLIIHFDNCRQIIIAAPLLASLDPHHLTTQSNC